MAWLQTVDLADIFHSDHLSFTVRRDGVVKRILDSSWMAHTKHPMYLASLLMNLAECETLEDFNLMWNHVYDLADLERVWIETR